MATPVIDKVTLVAGVLTIEAHDPDPAKIDVEVSVLGSVVRAQLIPGLEYGARSSDPKVVITPTEAPNVFTVTRA